MTAASWTASPAAPATASSIVTRSFDDTLREELSSLGGQGLLRALRTVDRRRGALVETALGTAVDFSSNDYLGLASDERIAAAAHASLHAQGVGAAAARLISGNRSDHDQLELAIAAYFDAERALTFSSGYAANCGVIPALVGAGDAIFADALNHASLIDGCRLSRARVFIYRHASADALAVLLDAHRSSFRRALIVTDGIFSMDGDSAPLAAIVKLARRHDAWTLVDDAHAVGVVGAGGQGTARRAGVHGEIDITLGTLGKAFGSAGAFVYGSRVLCDFLVNRARSFVFSTGALPSGAAAATAALAIARAEPARQELVFTNAHELRAALQRAGIAPLGDPGSHIVPVSVGGSAAETMRVGHRLAERGYLVGAVRPPTVPSGTSRLRLTVSAAHTPAQIHGLVDTLAEVVHELPVAGAHA